MPAYTDGDDTIWIYPAQGVSSFYDGGTGLDTIMTAGGCDLSNTSLISIESIANDLFTGVLTLTAAQLDPLVYIRSQFVTLTTGGTLNLAGVGGRVDAFTLSNSDNIFTLGGFPSPVGAGFGSSVYGGSGIDVLTGSALADGLYGGGNNDKLNGGDGADTLEGGAGDDVLNGGLAVDSLDGGDGTDILSGGAGADILRGGLGVDQVSGGDDADTIFIAQIANASQAAEVALEKYNGGTGVDTIITAGSCDLSKTSLISIESIANDLFTGVITLAAAQLDPLIYIRSQFVTLTTGGALNLSGVGGRVDVFTLSNSNNIFTLGGFLSPGGSGFGSSVYGGSGIDVLTGSALADGLYGGGNNDRLNGGDGADALFGDAGNDVLDGGVGTDRMEGGLGNDVYTVDTSLDQVVEGVDAGTDTVRSSISIALGDNLENLILVGSAAKGTGNGLDNVLTGNDAPNTLEGGSGADTLNGNGGSDTLAGGDGADKLLGGVASDTLSGGGGNDTLFGGGGNDRISGGAGSDRFYFNSTLNPTTNVDKILDFSVADDSVYLCRAVFAAIAASGRLAATAFHRGATAADTSDRIIYDQVAGKIFYDADGAGGAAQILFATVTAGTALTNADFVAYG